MQINKNKLKFYYLVSFCKGLVFYAPVALLIRTRRGISYQEFFILQIILSAVILLGEMPTGKIVDKFGYKNSLIVSQLVLFVARVLFLFANNLFVFVIEAILEGISFCLLSGTDSAYIYEIEGEVDYSHSIAVARSFGDLGFIISTVLFSLLYRYIKLNGLIYLTLISTFIGLLLLFLIPREIHTKETSPIPIREIFSSIKLKAIPILLESAVFNLGNLIVNFFFITKILEIGLSEEVMGPIIIAYSTVLLISPRLIELSRRTSINLENLCVISLAVSFLGLYLIDSVLSVIFMIIIPLLLNLLTIRNSKKQNIFAEENGLRENKATTISAFNIFNDGLEIIFLIFASFISKISANPIFVMFAMLVVVVRIINNTKTKKTP